MAFGSPSMLCGLACLLCLFLDPVASQGLCDPPNLVTIGTTGSVPLFNLDQQLCFGCIFPTGTPFVNIPVPLGTVWTITPSGGSQMMLSNTTMNVTLSGINGTVLFESPSSLLTFDMTEIGCSYTSAEVSISSHIATLTQAVVDPPSIMGVNEDGESFGIEGETVTLSCTNDQDSSLSEQMAWFDSEETMLTSFSLLRPQILTLANVARNQSGVYTCIIQVSAGGETQNLAVNTTLIVQYPALILSGPVASPSPKLHTGSNLTISCAFEGIPVPNVTWTVNGSDLDVDGNERLSVDTSDGSTQLIFNPVLGGDNGFYQCAVDNIIGNLSVSPPVNVIVQVPPEPVTNLNIVGTSTTFITLEWTLGFDGNAEITLVSVFYTTVDNYETMESDTMMLEPTATTTTIPGLEPNTQYNLTVFAENEVGISQGVTVQGWTQPNTPAAPTNVMVEANSSTSLFVTWMEPPFNSFLQTPFMTYKIEYSDDFTTKVDTIPHPAQSHTITDLMKGTYYSVRVALNNSAGEGEYSLSATNRTAVDPPTKVVDPVVTSYPIYLCASWKAPVDDGGAPIDYYRLELQNSTGDTEQNMIIEGNRLLYSFEDLVANTSYIVIISASNAEAGFGPSVQITQSTSSDFDILPSFTVDTDYISAISIEVIWSPQNDVHEYTIQYRPLGNNGTWDRKTCNCTTYLISGLESETEYEIRVILVSLNNCTRLSSPVVTETTQELVVVVAASGNGVATSGESFTLSCQLDSGEDAPSVMWGRTDGEDLPASSEVVDNDLIIESPEPADAGEYICSSGDANITYMLIVQDPPTVSPSATPTSVGGLAVEIVIVIAVVAAISVFAFVIVVIVAGYLCYRRKKTDIKQKYTMKKKGNVWMDEGAGGFISSTMNPNNTYRTTTMDEIDAPKDGGRRMTTDNQYTAATSFMHDRTPEKEGPSYVELEHQQQGYVNKDNRVEYMTVGSSTFHGSKELILSTSTTTDV